ncbi:MAG: amidohydrolase family protein, partial [Nitrospinota bacterium]
MFDFLFKNALICEGTGTPPFPGDLAVSGERIAAIGRLGPASSRRVVNCGGLILAPGFIDVHSHSDFYLLINPLAESKVRQGVTTEVGGNCGYSPAPLAGETLEERQKSWGEVYGLSIDWRDFSGYFSRLSAEGISLNFALLVGHNTVRGSVMGGSGRPAREEELASMVREVEAGMAQGALGLSTGLVYPPACYASVEEFTELARAARRGGGVLATHIRSEGDGLLEALEEVLRVARAASIPLQISHLKTTGQRNWGKLEDAFELIEAAQGEGLDITCDRYPYTASNTSLSALLPKWAHDGGRRAELGRLRSPGERVQIKEALKALHPEPDYWERVRISHLATRANKELEGLSLTEASSRQGKPVLDALLDLLLEEEERVEVMIFSMNEDNLERILQKPYVMVASDSGAKASYGKLGEGFPHPRGFGTFPRVLGRYVREKGLLSLPEAIRKMTFEPARRFGLKGRGRICPGAYADLVLFDPETIMDEASYREPHRYPSGIELVMVNGRVTVEG